MVLSAMWKASEVVGGEVAALPATDKNWLIFADEGGLGAGLADAISAKGVDAVLVWPGAEYGTNADGSHTVRRRERSDYAALLKELRKSGRIPNRIVHLWTTEQAGSLEEDLERGFYSLFHLAQAIGDQLTGDAIELCVISRDMQEVTGDEPLCPAKATVRGPCKVIRQEYANVATRSIDLSSAEPEAGWGAPLIEQLTLEVTRGARDQFVALRGGQRWVQQFEALRMETPAERSPRFRDDGVYLITGGVGGIGLAFAEYMHGLVKAKLVLVGRSGLPPKEQWAGLLAEASTDAGLRNKIEKVTALEAAGAEVLVLAADVANVEQMAEVVRQAVARFGTIHGVFHAAGVPAQGLTQLKSAAAAAAVLAPKVQGTLALEAALKGIQLDFLLLVSSVASFTGGGPGQIDYCAANAFLDGYARQHFRDNGITVAINFGEWQWDAWSAGLQGFQPEVREAFIANRRKFGIAFDEGMEAIHRVISTDVPQCVVVPQNFAAMVEGTNDCTAVRLTQEVNQARKRQQRSYPRPVLGTGFVAAGTKLERTITQIWQRTWGSRTSVSRTTSSSWVATRWSGCRSSPT